MKGFTYISRMNYTDRKKVKKYQIALRRGVFGVSKWDNHYVFDYLGMSSYDFANYLESKFVDDMRWENFGSVWQFGHVIPVELFDHNNEEELKLCWNYKNIFPIKCNDNRLFGACLLFAKMYFENKNSEDYADLLKFVYSKLPTYTKYLI